MNRPLVMMAVLYGFGVFLAGHFHLYGDHLFLSVGAALTVASIAYFAVKKAAPVLILALFAVLGAAVTGLTVDRTASPLAAWDNSAVVLEGAVVRDADVRPDRVIYLLAVHEVRKGNEVMRPGGRVVVSHREPDAVYGYGDLLRTRGVLRIPVSPGNPGEFDYRAYLERQGVAFKMNVLGTGAIERIGVDRGNYVVYLALTAKERLSAGLERALEPGAAALVRGITMGVRGEIAPEMNEAFTVTGVVHILSVSGLHVGFLVGLVLVFTRLGRLDPRWTLIMVVAVLAFYAVMVGFKPPVIRASVMALLLLAAHQMGRLRDWPTALALAALVILLGNPLSLYDPGFQLSFTATWGILYLGPLIVRGLDQLAAARRLSWWKPAAGWFLAVPLAAQLGVFPLIAYYYNLISPVSLPANLVTVPLVGLIFVLGFISALLGAFLPAAAWLTGPATGALVDLFLALVKFFAGVKGAYYYVPTPPLLLVGFWYLACWGLGAFTGATPWRERWPGAAALVGGSRRRTLGMLGVGLSLVFAFLIWPTQPSGRDHLEVHFLDVGQGDCTLIRTGTGATVLVDAGGWRGEVAGEPGAGEKVVVPYLRRIGVYEINILVITHPHDDHAGGVRAVADKLKVRNVVVAPDGGREELNPAYPKLIEELKQADIPVFQVWAGDCLRVDQRTILKVLAPVFPLLSGTRSDLNNNSVVLRLDHGARSFLFAGDVEQEGQARLTLGQEVRADVLKVPHHGSGAFTPDFFRAVRPSVAVITVGRANPFGHPHPRTLEALQDLGAEVYRTDLDGAVIVRTDGHSLEIETGRERKDLRPAA
ncbi:MAG: DNA internalization-related competence protein ComEC/Rec2 [Bacillota bacterium]